MWGYIIEVNPEGQCYAKIFYFLTFFGNKKEVLLKAP